MPHNTQDMKVAICSSGELYGGIEEFVYTLSDIMKNHNGLDVLVILFNKGQLYDKIRKKGVKVELIDTEFKYDPRTIFRLIKVFKKRRVNVVHANGYKANILAGIAGALCGTTLIKTEHGMQEPSRGLASHKMSFNLFLDKLITRLFVDQMIYVTKDIRSFYQNMHFSRRQAIIYNGIKPIVLSKKTSYLERGFFNIGIVGRISEVKGHIYLIDAVRKLPELDNLRLYVFGDGPLKEPLQAYCVKHSLSDRIFFSGFKKNIHDYVSELDLLVMPSLHEGLPYALLEAMYLKIPIIASDVGGIREILENDIDSVLVREADTDKLADAIKRLARNSSLGESLKENAHKKVVKDFMLEKMAAKYLDTYAQYIKN